MLNFGMACIKPLFLINKICMHRKEEKQNEQKCFGDYIQLSKG